MEAISEDDARMQSTRLPLRTLLAAAAGALSVLAIPPFSLLFVVPLAFSTLFVMVQGISAWRALLVGWSFGLGQFGFGISWIAESFYVDAERFGVLAIPSVAGLAAVLALFPGLAVALFAQFKRLTSGRPLASSLLLATCWFGTEWLRGHLLTGFPWNLAGYTLVEYDALRQPAAWIGSYGLSFIVVFAGALPGAAFLAEKQARLKSLAVVGIVVLAVWAAGTVRIASDAPAAPGIDLRLVQGNIPQGEKWEPGSRERTLTRYLDLSDRPGKFDLLLWPETAFPGFLDEDAAARSRIAGAVPEHALLLTGAPDRVETDDGSLYFNALQAYDSSGRILAGYAKHHLVPFGEYVPLSDWLPLERMTEGLGDFAPGPGPRTLALPGAPLVAAAICYEIIFPGHVIDAEFRPDWIYNATNDAWFGTSIGPEQHLASARMRAVEEGLPVVRAANTGISAVIDATGAVLERLDTGTTGIIDAPLPGARAATLYSRFGDWTSLVLIATCWIFLGGITAVGARPKGHVRKDECG
ncbi:Apolipoprotein N-acyltransferase [Tranquillimonas alkanivorans]|uniref:Apolipoprotein N-acyltransferase n=2 Tax=Tranquillimonas alkanivorans TaxID=441119 RepID=A0A1I5WWJ8_9RHOB|nr:apolipoprotein N-acyltransferase [Tranquillimonas alkanivorans]SFQ24123.1 Apolipoprotein N-acyltransferase [Tranquillimonas alkanivorans]